MNELDKITGITLLSINFTTYLDEDMQRIISEYLETVILSYDIHGTGSYYLLSDLCWKEAVRYPKTQMAHGDLWVDHDVQGRSDLLYNDAVAKINWIMSESSVDLLNIFQTMNIIDVQCVGVTAFRASYLIKGH